MIATDGRAKILDFGLAKPATHTLPGSDDALTVQPTQAGMIVGTVSYMSPEQARGKATDHRSDQFSFGLLLYEMATGRKAFDKPESVQTMSAIISDEPPPIEARIPPPLRWTIDRCRSKEPSGRYDSTRDLFHELRNLRDHVSEASGTATGIAEPVPGAPRRPRSWPLPAAFVLGVLATLAVLVFQVMTQPERGTGNKRAIAISPDGRTVAAWQSLAGGTNTIWLVFLRFDASEPGDFEKNTTRPYSPRCTVRPFTVPIAPYVPGQIHDCHNATPEFF